MSDELLDEIIKKHGYVVTVVLDENDPYCVNVDFADKKLAYYRVVTDEEGDIYGLAYNSSDMDGENEEFIPLSPSVVRLYILCDIFRQCRQMKLPYEIIRYMDENENPAEFVDLLDLKLDESYLNEEKLLESAMGFILNEEVDENEVNETLENDGLLQKFNLLRGTLL